MLELLNKPRAPRPTPGPSVRLLNSRLNARQNGDLCGWATGLPDSEGYFGSSVAMTCGAGFGCAADAGYSVEGCCPLDIPYEQCQINTECMDATAVAQLGGVGSGTAACTLEGFEYCATVIFSDNNYISWICSPFPGGTVGGILGTNPPLPALTPIAFTSTSSEVNPTPIVEPSTSPQAPGSGTVTVTEVSTTPASGTSSTWSTSGPQLPLGAIIGIAVGGFFTLVGLAILIIWLRRRAMRRKWERKNERVWGYPGGNPAQFTDDPKRKTASVTVTSISPPDPPLDADEACRLLDVTAMIRSLDSRADHFAETVERVVGSAIKAHKTADLIEVGVYNSAELEAWLENPKLEEPKPLYSERPLGRRWMELLIKYMRDRPQPGTSIKAGVENVVIDACQLASQEYFTSPEVTQLLGTELADCINANERVRDAVLATFKQTGKLVKREVEDVIKAHGHAVVADRLHDILAHQAAAFSATAGGAAVIHLVSAALAVPAVKVAILHAISATFLTSATHSLVGSVAKHCGITTLAVLIFGHSVGAATVGAFALPILALFLKHQYDSLPKKLAKDMPPKIAAQIRSVAPQLNQSVITTLKKSVLENLLELPEEAAQKFHELAMEELN